MKNSLGDPIMYDLKINQLDDCFTIECHSPDFNNLRLVSKDKTVSLDQIQSCVWSLPFSLVFQILQDQGEIRATFYYSNNDIEISSANFNIVIVSEKLVSEYKNHTFSLYFTVDGFLKIIKDQNPSARSYYLHSEITSMFQKDSQTLVLHLSLASKILDISEIDLVLSSRHDKKQSIIPASIIRSNKTDLNNYQQEVEIIVKNPAKIMYDMISNFEYNEYNLSVFDYWIQIRVKEQKITNYRFRLAGPRKISDSMWFTLDATNMLAVTWYETANGYTSNRISVLQKDSYELMENIPTKISLSENEKPILLICEYPYKAQDNGFFFFKYMMEKQDKIEPYYIIASNSTDINSLEPFKSNTVIYKSPQHIKLFTKADFLAHTHSPKYALPSNTTKEMQHLENNIHKIFLQHGILGFRNLEYLYGRKSEPNLINSFLVSSPREFQIVRDELFYPEKDIKITGLARFDNLLKGNSFIKRYFLRKKILIMPTWRKGQETLSDEEFLKTPFYKAFSTLISNKTFEKIAKEHHLNINFYLHNNFQKYNHLFKSTFVNILDAKDTTVQNLLKNHGILITDFSSVGLDFAIQHRPVLYYQFPEDLQDQSDVDRAKKFLPGPIYIDQDNLIAALRKKIKKNSLDQNYQEMLEKNIYCYHDRNACKRIYQFMLSLINTASRNQKNGHRSL